jgi:hypothetical protein
MPIIDKNQRLAVLVKTIRAQHFSSLSAATKEEAPFEQMETRSCCLERYRISRVWRCSQTQNCNFLSLIRASLKCNLALVRSLSGPDACTSK